MFNPIGLNALIKTGSKVDTGKIIGVATNHHAVVFQVLVQLPDARMITVEWFDRDRTAILVPEDQIAPAWKKVLADNPNCKVAVAYEPGTDGKLTTLVCCDSLIRLTAVVTSTEVSDVKISEEMETPAEERPEVVSTHREYWCGSHVLNMTATPYE